MVLRSHFLFKFTRNGLKWHLASLFSYRIFENQFVIQNFSKLWLQRNLISEHKFLSFAYEIFFKSIIFGQYRQYIYQMKAEIIPNWYLIIYRVEPKFLNYFMRMLRGYELSDKNFILLKNHFMLNYKNKNIFLQYNHLWPSPRPLTSHGHSSHLHASYQHQSKLWWGYAWGCPIFFEVYHILFLPIFPILQNPWHLSLVRTEAKKF